MKRGLIDLEFFDLFDINRLDQIVMDRDDNHLALGILKPMVRAANVAKMKALVLEQPDHHRKSYRTGHTMEYSNCLYIGQIRCLVR